MPNSLMVIIAIALAALFVWALVLTIVFIRAFRAYKKITQGITKKDLKNTLTSIVDSLKLAETEIKSIQQDIDELELAAKGHLQKVGFLRFNPFSDTGGNQSFCLCLLDEYNDGIVITSLHSRDQTRIYSKKIVTGKAEGQELSKEEQEVIKQALKANRNTKRKK